MKYLKHKSLKYVFKISYLEFVLCMLLVLKCLCVLYLNYILYCDLLLEIQFGSNRFGAQFQRHHLFGKKETFR